MVVKIIKVLVLAGGSAFVQLANDGLSDGLEGLLGLLELFGVGVGVLLEELEGDGDGVVELLDLVLVELVSELLGVVQLTAERVGVRLEAVAGLDLLGGEPVPLSVAVTVRMPSESTSNTTPM